MTPWCRCVPGIRCTGDLSDPDASIGALTHSPLHESIAHWLHRLPAGRFPSVEDLDALAAEVPALPPGFGFDVAHHALTAAAYERGIAISGRVPTRHGDWHDLFNALVWLSFPRLKLALNRIHVRALADDRAGAVQAAGRGALRDLATLIDESGLVLACDDPTLVQALATRAWGELFVDRRTAVCRSMHFLTCGHAVLDRGRRPWKGLTARVLVLPVEQTFVDLDRTARLAFVDEAAARWIEGEAAARLGTRGLLHLPVLGIPGWWGANANPTFYDDPQVFRGTLPWR